MSTEANCAFPECPKPVRARTLCMGHYRQQQLGKPLTPLRPHKPKGTRCAFLDCPLPYWGNGLCRAHNRERPAQAPYKIQRKNAGRWCTITSDTDRMDAHRALNALRARNPETAFRLIIGKRHDVA